MTARQPGSVPPDEELVRRFQAGDRAAFAELVRRYQDRVYTLSRRWLGDAAVAEEVAQDVFVAIYRSLAGFRGDARLSTWIYRITVNHCKNRHAWRTRRAAGRHDSLDAPRDGGEGPARELPSPDAGTDRGIHRSEAAEIVQRALDLLEEEQRVIIVLRDIQDLSYDEIAEVLDLPRGTVKSRLHRARARLARALAELGITASDVLE